jgi:transcription initiation factor TFIIIB Brf1 subunit/transcription initiation factor TFIIB
MEAQVVSAIRRNPDECYTDIARTLGCSPTLVRYYAKRNGIDPRPPSYRLEINERLLRNTRLTDREVADQTGVSEKTVRNRRREVGVRYSRTSR